MYNHRSAQKYDKQTPPYELKVILADGENAIRQLLYLQQNYFPSDHEVNSKLRFLKDHLIKKYGSIANVRLATESDTLYPLIKKEVEDLFSKNYRP